MSILFGRINIYLIVLFVGSIFLTSDDSTFRLFSMTLSNLIILLMMLLSILQLFLLDKVRFAYYPLRRHFVAILGWVMLSLIISKLDEARTMPLEVYSYSWAIGINSPDFRGIAFFLRLLQSIFLIEFIINNICDKKKYIKIFQCFIIAYALFCLIPLGQLVLLKLFHVSTLNVFLSDGYDFPRIGAYVGEPSVLASIICSGFFPLLAMLMCRCNIGFSRFFLLWCIFVSTIVLYFTYSASIITGMGIAFLIVWSKSLKWRYFLMFSGILAIFLLMNSTLQEQIIGKVIGELTSVNIRTLSWILGLEMMQNYFLFGVGIGQAPFYNAASFPELLTVTWDMDTLFDYAAMRHTPMNSYIEWAAETGFGGIVLLVATIYALYVFQARTRRRPTMFVNFIHMAFGPSLLSLAISANSFPGLFYMGHFDFLLAMYISGLLIGDINKIPQGAEI